MTTGGEGASAEQRGEESPFPFTYAEFTVWYERLSRSQLQPARATFVRLLNETLDSELDEFDRKRIRLGDGRIKQPHRVWTKVLSERYRSKISGVDDIADAIDDLVGLRLVCNNICDVSTLQRILGQLPDSEDAPNASLAIEVESERTYWREPKQSGYRAYHINLTTSVPGRDGFHRVRGELQVRTLLQEGWGELTHEDTYKPGAELPKLAATIARRMADLLATVDDMAEDLRQELDRSLRAAMDSGLGSASVEPGVAPSPPGVQDYLVQEAPFSPADIEAELRVIVQGLTRPAPLAAVAQELQTRLGPEVAAGWGSHGTFKKLLRAAVPDVRINEAGPQYVVPEGTEVAPHMIVTIPADDADANAPSVLRELAHYDRWVPTVGPVRLQYLMEALMKALADETWRDLGLLHSTSASLVLREVNALTRHIRDVMERDGRPINRHHLDYLLKALLWSGNLRAGMPLGLAIDILVEWFSSRAAFLGARRLDDDAKENLRRWLQGEQ